MIDFYNSDSATRAINMFLDLTQKSTNIHNKSVLIMSVIAYKGEVNSAFLKKVFNVPINRDLQSLEKGRFIRVTRTENGTKFYECTYSPKGVNVYPEDIMYVFSNALFNIGKYIKSYDVTSWNVLASIVELPLRLAKNGMVSYNPNTLNCIRGKEPNKKANRSKLIKIGVIRHSGSKQEDNYKLNQHAYLLGAK